MGLDSAAAQLAPITVAVPILAAALALVAGRLAPQVALDGLAALGAAVCVGLDAFLLTATGLGRTVSWLGGWSPTHGLGVGIDLVVDPFGAGCALMAASLMLASLVFGWRYFESAHGHYQALMLLFLAGMQGFALTGDVFDMFVFFELMGAAAYALTGYKIEDPTAVQGAVNFGIINSFGAYLSLMGVGILYSRVGQLQLPQLHDYVAHHHADAVIVVSFVLIVTGFLVKAAMAPFHFWLADAHAVAPPTVCVLFSGIMVELGLYALGRVYWVVFAGTIPVADFQRAFVVFGTATAVVGALMCFAQRHLKRLLAYSTISHVGLFLLGMSTVSPDGTAGAALYVIGHAGVKSALFLLSGVILNRYGSIDEYHLYGRGRRARVMPWLYGIGAVALAGMPPFGLGLGKSVSEDALGKAGYPWEIAVFVLVSALTAGAVLRAGARIYRGWGSRRPAASADADETTGEEQPDTSEELTRTPITMVLPIVVLLLGALAVGVVPAIATGVGEAAARFLQGSGYAAQALGGAAPAPVHPVAGVAWSWAGVGFGLLSTALAFGFAALALWGQRVPQGLRDIAAWGAAALRPVRRMHSGHVGDYIAWLLAGVSALGALIGLPLR